MNERFLALLTERGPLVVYTAALPGAAGIFHVSAGVTAQLGYSPSDFTSDPNFWRAHVHPDDLERVLAAGADDLARGGYSQEYRFRHKDGSWRWMRDEGTLLRDEHGAPHEFVGFWIDVTERHRQAALEDALRASERGFRAIIDGAPDGMLVHRDGKILYVNRSMLAMLHAERAEQVIGQPAVEVVAPSDREGAAGRIRSVQQGALGPAREVTVQALDGALVPAEVRGNLVIFDGEPAVLAIFRDLTERKQLQAQLMTSDRLSSVGALAAGVAHEINNPLTSVVGNLELATRLVEQMGEIHPEIHELAEQLADARIAAQRVRHIVRDLKLFSRGEEDQRGAVDLHHVLESSLRMAWNEIRHRAQLVKDFGRVPLVEANESRLGQVFLNLIVNAVQAMEPGEVDRNRLSVATRIDDGGRVVVEVGDTGTGIADEHMAKLFTPFFTTKPVGVGTGLGLSICHRIVSDLGGEIVVKSAVGKGTVITVSLPRAITVPADRPRSRSSAPGARRGRVLVVDDEEAVGTVVRRTLSKEHDVLTVTSGGEALAMLERGEQFDVILCDLMMPHMTGMDLYAELARRLPQAAERVVFLSGGAFTAKARSFLDEVPNARLDKPFEGDALRSLVNQRCKG